MSNADELTSILGENAEASKVKGWLDTGIPELNKAIGAKYDTGVPYGRLIEVFGPSGTGKTFVATQIMASAQKLGGIAFFADHERSFEPGLAASLGLDLDTNNFRHLKPQTFEESIDLFVKTAILLRKKKLVPDDVPCVWVFDSVAAMIPRSKLYDDRGNVRSAESLKMNDSLALAKACSQNYPTLKQFSEDYNFTILLLNQIRLKPGVMYGDPTTTPGGMAAEFFADVRINLGKKDLIDKESKDTYGFEIRSKVVKNKVARPHKTAAWQILFNDNELGVTIDKIATNVEYLLRMDKIPQSGNRVEWEGKKLYKSQLIEQLKQDPDGYQKLMDILLDEDA